MTKPMPLDAFARLPATARAMTLDGLSGLIDTVAAEAPASHRFLRFQWFAAALEAYGGEARTIVVEREGDPVIALPLIAIGPRWAHLAAVPGCHLPFRSFPMSIIADPSHVAMLLAELGRQANAVRIGPVRDGDASVAPLIEAARMRGWAVVDRVVGHNSLLDSTADTWPRSSTLEENHVDEKHRAYGGELAWHHADGAKLTRMFDTFAAIENNGRIASDGDGGRDAAFAHRAHGTFWRAAATDPVLAEMFRVALPTIDGGRDAYSDEREIGAAAAAARREWLLLRPGLPAAVGRLIAGRWRRSANAENVPAA